MSTHNSPVDYVSSEYYTVQELIEKFNTTRQTIGSWIRFGHIPTIAMAERKDVFWKHNIDELVAVGKLPPQKKQKQYVKREKVVKEIADDYYPPADLSAEDLIEKYWNQVKNIGKILSKEQSSAIVDSVNDAIKYIFNNFSTPE